MLITKDIILFKKILINISKNIIFLFSYKVIIMVDAK